MGVDEKDIVAALNKGRVKILVKANAKEDRIEKFDSARAAWRITIRAPAEENKANSAIIKFFSRLVGRQVRIVYGLTSKVKIIELL